MKIDIKEKYKKPTAEVFALNFKLQDQITTISGTILDFDIEEEDDF